MIFSTGVSQPIIGSAGRKMVRVFGSLQGLAQNPEPAGKTSGHSDEPQVASWTCRGHWSYPGPPSAIDLIVNSSPDNSSPMYMIGQLVPLVINRPNLNRLSGAMFPYRGRIVSGSVDVVPIFFVSCTKFALKWGSGCSFAVERTPVIARLWVRIPINSLFVYPLVCWLCSSAIASDFPEKFMRSWAALQNKLSIHRAVNKVCPEALRDRLSFPLILADCTLQLSCLSISRATDPATRSWSPTLASWRTILSPTRPSTSSTRFITVTWKVILWTGWK